MKSTSTAEILGISRKPEALTIGNNCVICGAKITQERMKALRLLNTPASRLTHVQCSQTEKIKGVYMGEVGTSKLQLVDKLYDDSVRGVFKHCEAEDVTGPDEAEEVGK